MLAEPERALGAFGWRKAANKYALDGSRSIRFRLSAFVPVARRVPVSHGQRSPARNRCLAMSGFSRRQMTLSMK